MDMIWPWVAVALTLIVLSRVVGDNPIFRFSQYLFVGLGLGYAATVVFTEVLVRPINTAVQDGPTTGQVFLLIPMALGFLLLTRIGGQQLSWTANFPLAILFGVAAALALTGTLLGTLLPQIKASLISIGDLNRTNWADLQAASAVIGQLVMALGTILVLMSFAFTRTQAPGADDAAPAKVGAVAKAGRWLLIISLGVVFAGALLTYQTALIDRIQFITQQFGLG